MQSEVQGQAIGLCSPATRLYNIFGRCTKPPALELEQCMIAVVRKMAAVFYRLLLEKRINVIALLIFFIAL
jgi:hypothetical protein